MGCTHLTQLYVPESKGYVCQDPRYLTEVLISTVEPLNGHHTAAWAIRQAHRMQIPLCPATAMAHICDVKRMASGDGMVNLAVVQYKQTQEGILLSFL